MKEEGNGEKEEGWKGGGCVCVERNGSKCGAKVL